MTLPIDAKTGDVFLVYSPGFIAKTINAIQAFWAKDLKSKFSHAGLIWDDFGGTLESSWTVEVSSLWPARANNRILVVRPDAPDYLKEEALLSIYNSHHGDRYPIMRLPIYALGMARHIHWKFMVCSELVAKYLFYLNLRDYHWFGTNVDDLEEELRHWRGYSIVFDGILPEYYPN